MYTGKVINFMPKGDGLEKYRDSREETLKKVSLMNMLSGQIEQERDMKSAIAALNNFKKANESLIYNPRNGSYILDNYYMVPSLYTNSSYKFINNLKDLNRLGFCRTSAPEIVNIAKTKDNKFAVCFYRINDTKGGILLPYMDVRKQVPLEKKENFLQEQAVLLKNTSKYNPAILESFDYWGVTPDTHNIFIDSWNNLKECKTEKEGRQLAERWEELIK